jgi:tRNA (mo5U34)-methyltransferase
MTSCPVRSPPSSEPDVILSLKAPPATPRRRVDEEIAAMRPWFHNFTLPNGEQTAPNHPLGDFPRLRWDLVRGHLPEDLSGRTALDIGCNAGFYCFELARRGAQVFGIDPDEHFLSQARWIAARYQLAPRVRFQRLSIWDLLRDRPELPRSFDVVLFMGVLYQLRYPLLGLDIAAHRTADLLAFQTLTAPDEPAAADPPEDASPERGRPRLSLMEVSIASDTTNWWIPNPAGCETMLRSAGLDVFARPGHEIYVCKRTGNRRLPAEAASLNRI